MAVCGVNSTTLQGLDTTRLRWKYLKYLQLSKKWDSITEWSSKEKYWGARVADSRVLLCEIPNTWEDNGNNRQGMVSTRMFPCNSEIRKALVNQNLLVTDNTNKAASHSCSWTLCRPFQCQAKGSSSTSEVTPRLGPNLSYTLRATLM